MLFNFVAIFNSIGEFREMEPCDKRDLKTASIFVVLALLTTLFVFGFRLVLFAPIAEGNKGYSPVVEAQKAP